MYWIWETNQKSKVNSTPVSTIFFAYTWLNQVYCCVSYRTVLHREKKSPNSATIEEHPPNFSEECHHHLADIIVFCYSTVFTHYTFLSERDAHIWCRIFFDRCEKFFNSSSSSTNNGNYKLNNFVCTFSK